MIPNGTEIIVATITINSVPTIAWAIPPYCKSSPDGVILMSSVRYEEWNASEPFWKTVMKIDNQGIVTAMNATAITAEAMRSVTTLAPRLALAAATNTGKRKAAAKKRPKNPLNPVTWFIAPPQLSASAIASRLRIPVAFEFLHGRVGTGPIVSTATLIQFSSTY